MVDYLITGGEGFIGRSLTKRLRKLKKTFRVMDLNPSNRPECMLMDIAEEGFYVKMPDVKADILVHLAAFTNVRKSIELPSQSFLENCLGTINCLELAKEVSATSFVFASSVGAPQACSPYSASKLAGEAISRAYRESYGLKTSILRLSNVYGPYSLHKESVIPKFIKTILKKEPLQVFGDGKQTRDFIFVDDVVETITSLKDESILTVAAGCSHSILSVIDRLSAISKRLINFTPEVYFLPPTKGEVLKINVKSDINAKVTFDEGLERTFKWFMEQGDG